jgi:hypothetical protein
MRKTLLIISMLLFTLSFSQTILAECDVDLPAGTGIGKLNSTLKCLNERINKLERKLGDLITSNPETVSNYQFSNRYLSARVESASRSDDGRELTIALVVENQSKEDLHLLLENYGVSAIDDRGTTYTLYKVNGVNMCSFSTRVNVCSERSSYSLLTPKSRHTIVFSLRTNKGSQGTRVDMATDFYAWAGEEEINLPVGISAVKLQSSSK